MLEKGVFKFMDILIREYTRDRIKDVLDFEYKLRVEENFWGWEIDDAYISAVDKALKRKNLRMLFPY